MGTDTNGISHPTPADYEELAEVWEAAVRSTHHFLGEADIAFYRPLVREVYLPATELYIMRNGRGRIAAFMGLSEAGIEMLFVRPDEQRKGYGRRLVALATGVKGLRRVDVNEQNEAAFAFYRRLGFTVASRDEHDEQGRPFPILHLELR